MKACRHAVLILTALFVTVNVGAQTPLMELLKTAPADRSVDAAVNEEKFEVDASTDDTSATIKATRTLSYGKMFNTIQYSASAPLSKSGGATSIASWSGFPDAFTAKVKVTSHWARGRASAQSISNPAAARKLLETTCAEMRAAAEAKGVASAAELECDSGNMSEHAPAASRAAFDALFWDNSEAHYIFGGTATAGHRVFEYVREGDLEKKTATRTPWGVSGFVAVLPRSTLMLITAGAEFRDKYKDADEETVCPPTTGTDPQKCKTGPFGEPDKTQQKLLFTEMRTQFAAHAMSLKVAYDFESDHWSGDLPIYLVKTSSGALAGGIRAGWEEDKEWQFGVFVSSTFSLLP